MSEQDVELVRGIYRGDPRPFFDLLDDDVEVDTTAVRVIPDHPERIRGRDAVIEFYRHYWGTWDDYVLEPVEIVDAGEGRVVVGHYERGRGKGSGAPFERRWAVVWTLRAGKLARLQFFDTREDALAAAKLRG
jgi:ketosteroid isomerase-like protein